MLDAFHLGEVIQKTEKFLYKVIKRKSNQTFFAAENKPHRHGQIFLKAAVH